MSDLMYLQAADAAVRCLADARYGITDPAEVYAVAREWSHADWCHYTGLDLTVDHVPAACRELRQRKWAAALHAHQGLT